jgi:ATP-binding cassette subfamily C (CFTR/MRP) protein 1
VYVFTGKGNAIRVLESDVAFSALSLFRLQYNPMIALLFSSEDVRMVTVSFHRIQEYLMSKERTDLTTIRASDNQNENSRSDSEFRQDMIPLEASSSSHINLSSLGSHSALNLTNVTVAYSATGKAVLRSLNLDIARSKTTIVAGPVASGKSTLLKLLLGEISEVSGKVTTAFAKAAFCPQSPWMTSSTIRQNIVGMSLWDQPWYNTVVRSCALLDDLEALPHGDLSKIGVHGSHLSGGQQKRVVSIAKV